MRYTAILDGEERIVEITPAGERLPVAIGDKVFEIDAVHLQADALSLIVGTRSYRCDVEPGKDGRLKVLVGDSIHSLEILDERKLRMRRASGSSRSRDPSASMRRCRARWSA